MWVRLAAPMIRQTGEQKILNAVEPEISLIVQFHASLIIAI